MKVVMGALDINVLNEIHTIDVTILNNRLQHEKLHVVLNIET